MLSPHLCAANEPHFWLHDRQCIIIPCDTKRRSVTLHFLKNFKILSETSFTFSWSQMSHKYQICYVMVLNGSRLGSINCNHKFYNDWTVQSLILDYDMYDLLSDYHWLPSFHNVVKCQALLLSGHEILQVWVLILESCK